MNYSDLLISRLNSLQDAIVRNENVLNQTIKQEGQDWKIAPFIQKTLEGSWNREFSPFELFTIQHLIKAGQAHPLSFQDTITKVNVLAEILKESGNYSIDDKIFQVVIKQLSQIQSNLKKFFFFRCLKENDRSRIKGGDTS